MKKLTTYLTISLFAFLMIACKGEDKKADNPYGKKYSAEVATTNVNFVAYKTTDKVPVKGKFTKATITKQNGGDTAQEALNGLEFTIPVSSLDTADETRNAKILKAFFGTMKDTENITGKFKMNNETSGSVLLKMNGVSQELPITYFADGQMVNIEAVMNLDNWQAQAAIKALNLICKDLHKGADGVSKTWSEVKINVITYLKAN